jgi:FkbM family methyltransferase
VASRFVDVIVTYNEVNTRHGTGVLLRKIFSDCHDLTSIRSVNTYGGEHVLGTASLCLPRTGLSRREVYELLIWWFGTHTVRRVLCVPYGRDDAVVALAVSELFGAPLATWIMDDQNIDAQGIPDELMEELLTKSRLRLAISAEMRVAYEAKYRLKFWLLPPVVSSSLLCTTPPLEQTADPSRGILVGNVWGQRWLDLLRRAVKDADVKIDWYCNSGTAPGWLKFEPGALTQDGIALHDPLPEPVLVEVLRKHAFAVVPSGTLDASDDNHTVARLSLPTRIPFIVASSTPIVVLGSPRTAVARFVTRYGLGAVAGYTGDALRHAVALVTAPERQDAIRRNATAMAEGFKGDGIAEWIWASLGEGKPLDSRFEQLLPGDPSDLSYYVEPPVPPGVWRDFHGIFQVMRRLKDRGFCPDFVVDVGASTGVWSHAVAEVFPDSRFVLVDPLLSRHDSCSRQHYIARRQNFETIEAALADKSGRLLLQVTEDLYRSSLFELSPRLRCDAVDVEVQTVDQLVRERGLSGRGMLKVDVQHAEHLVIEGARDSLARSIDVVVLELTLAGAPKGAKTFLEMLNLMQELGFRYYDDAGYWRAPEDGSLLEKDIVFVRAGG